MVRTRAQRFDDHVLDAVERLERRWESELVDVEFAVEEVPQPWGPEESPAGPAEDPVPLGRSYPRLRGTPPRVVVYRRPVETRAVGERALASLVHDVVVERVAELLGIEPQVVDPGYTGADDEGA